MTDPFFIAFEDSDENIAMRYADDVLRHEIQLPLALSWSTYSGVADPGFLFNDDTTQSLRYPAGTNRTAIQIQTKDRYSGLTITVLSGLPSVYVQVSEYFADLNPAFIGAPYTTSGDSGAEDLYLATYTEDTPDVPEDYWIPLPGPGSYKIVFPTPVVGNAITVTHSGSAPYEISQILPRKSVQAYDLEVNSIKAYHVSATLIDTIALQVSDSIVVGPDLIGAKSIDGSKIIDGTISGVLIRDGTVTGNNIFAGTISGVLIAAETITANNIAVSGITADRLSVTQLDAVAAKMGTLVVNSGVTVGTNGYITVPSGYISAGKAKLDSTGLQIGNVASSNLPSITDTLRIAGSGTAGNIVGMALYNGAFSSTDPQAVLQLDSTNALELEMRTISGMVNINFPEETTEGQFLQVYNADLYLRRSSSSSNITPGAIYGTDSDGTTRYYLGHDYLRLNDNTADTFIVDAASGDITTLGSVDVNAGKFKVTAGTGTIETHGNIHVGTGSHVFEVDGSTGNTTIVGTLGVTGQTTLGALNASGAVGFGTSNNKVTIAAATGDTAIAGTLGVTGDVTTTNNVNVGGSLQTTYGVLANTQLSAGYDGVSAYKFTVGSTGDVTTVGGIFAGTSNNKFTVASATGKITSAAMGYITVRRTADVAITTAGTTIIWQTATRSNNISFSSDTITIENAGYYTFSATFATVANLTSLRMTLVRGTINYVSTLHGAGLSTGGGYMFNFSAGFYAGANTTYKIILTPSANTTLNANAEGLAGPSPILNIYQAIGV